MDNWTKNAIASTKVEHIPVRQGSKFSRHLKSHCYHLEDEASSYKLFWSFVFTHQNLLHHNLWCIQSQGITYVNFHHLQNLIFQYLSWFRVLCVLFFRGCCIFWCMFCYFVVCVRCSFFKIISPWLFVQMRSQMTFTCIWLLSSRWFFRWNIVLFPKCIKSPRSLISAVRNEEQIIGLQAYQSIYVINVGKPTNCSTCPVKYLNPLLWIRASSEWIVSYSLIHIIIFNYTTEWPFT